MVYDWIINQNEEIKNIPAVTIVAEWSKALTGVGAAIASAIQPENGRFVDLVKAAKIIEELKLTIGLFKYSLIYIITINQQLLVMFITSLKSS